MCKKSEMRPATDAERKALGVPPAYTDVMVATDPSADLVATAITGVGKTFYKYSQAYVERQKVEKFERVARLRKTFEALADRVMTDSENFSSDDHDVAMTIRLIMQTGLRNGGEKQGEADSFGASSLLLEHVTADKGGVVRLSFPGKKGILQEHELTDLMISNYVHDRWASPGASAKTPLFPHDATATLKYLQRIGGAIKVHDLRTLYATVLAEALVTKYVTSAGSMKKLKKLVSIDVAKKLGNAPGMALKTYIDPSVFGE